MKYLFVTMVLVSSIVQGATKSFWSTAAIKNTTSKEIVVKQQFKLQSANGLRFHFSTTVLGPKTLLRFTSAKDHRVLTMDDRILQAYHYTTPYFNGNEVLMEIIVQPKASFAGITLQNIETPTHHEATDTVCNNPDKRAPSTLTPVARMMMAANDQGGCTGTLIGHSCMISAGHCVAYLNIAQFNVPISNPDGTVNYPPPADQYPLLKVYGSQDDGPGMDWSVYRINTNPISQKHAGDVQGFLNVRDELPADGEVLRITGFGTADGDRNLAQQSSVGPDVKSDQVNELHYRVDTEPGNSGSSVVIDKTNEVVGIHTHGGCSVGSSDTFNTGTALAGKTDLIAAIKSCLADEK